MTVSRHDAIDIGVRELDGDGTGFQASNWLWGIDRLLLKVLVFGSALLIGVSSGS